MGHFLFAAAMKALPVLDEPNLFNKEGLPASSFRTDAWPVETKPVEFPFPYR
jgi:hypothetical protein